MLSTILTIVIGFYIVMCALALVSDHLIFQPQSSSYQDTDFQKPNGNVVEGHRVFDGGLVKLKSGDGKDQQTITAIWLPNPDARYTLLFSHGNAEDIGDDLPMFNMFREAGFSVFAYDYRGYGTSEGRPSENGVYADVEAAYDYITGTLHVPADHVISMGRSVGCAPALHLAVSRPAAALIIEAPFLSAFRVLTRVRLLPWDKFNNARVIGRVHVPVLVIHGRADSVVPFWHGERIYELANEPKQSFWVDNAGHNDVLFTAGAKYVQAVQQFAASLP